MTPLTFLIIMWLAMQLPCAILLGGFLREGFETDD